MVCSPHSYEILAVGHLVSEGILQSRDDLVEVKCQPDQGIVWVQTAGGVAQTGGSQNENNSQSGKNQPLHSLDGIEPIPADNKTRFSVQALLNWTASLEKGSKTFDLTGGVHEAALAFGEGFETSYEDIGRHNALDRILGYVYLNGTDTSDKAVIVSSRISSEMLLKAARIAVPVIVSRAAPTCLSIDLAEKIGITLVGFARGNSLNVYSHPGRIVE